MHAQSPWVSGSYTRDLVTPSGRIEALKVTRDREGEFHSQVFARYNCYEPEMAEALTQMFVRGTSTHKVGKVAEKLMGGAPGPGASAVSRLNQTLPSCCHTSPAEIKYHERQRRNKRIFLRKGVNK